MRGVWKKLSALSLHGINMLCMKTDAPRFVWSKGEICMFMSASSHACYFHHHLIFMGPSASLHHTHYAPSLLMIRQMRGAVLMRPSLSTVAMFFCFSVCEMHAPKWVCRHQKHARTRSFSNCTSMELRTIALDVLSRLYNSREPSPHALPKESSEVCPQWQTSQRKRLGHLHGFALTPQNQLSLQRHSKGVQWLSKRTCCMNLHC